MSLTTFSPPSSEVILQQLLQSYQAIANANGYNVSVAPGSEIYIRFSAVAQQQAVFYQIALQQFDSRMPDTATGSDLDRVLNQFGLVRKPATSSEGFIQLIGSAPQALTAGMLLSAKNGLQYQVATSGVYQNASSAAAIANVTLSYVPVVAVSQGSNTDLGVGQVMTWINIPALTQSTAPVVVALTGGSDAETDSQARFRLLQALQNPPNAGNAQWLINLASTIDPIVQSGFVYPDFNGAGTQLIALMGYQSDGYYIGRDIPHLATDNITPSILTPYNVISNNYGVNLSNDNSAILGQLPVVAANQYATMVSTVNNQATSLALFLNLPYPIGNYVNGLGGGWVNNYGQTWPVPLAGSTFVGGQVATVTSPTSISISSYSTTSGADATYDPVPGFTQITWIDRSGGSNNGWQVVTATILSVISKAAAGPTNIYNYSVTLDTPLVCGITVSGQTDFYGNTQVAVGDYISPAAINAQNYLNTLMDSYASLGPGEIAPVGSVLKQLGASRQPATQSLYSPVLGVQFLQAMQNNNAEVYNVQKLYNSTDTINNVPPYTVPPTIFIPQNLGWYDSNRIT